MNKKISLIMYYTGLLFGIIIINYMIHNQKEYADYLIEGFWRMAYIDRNQGQDLFVFLFLKRIKQLTLLCLIYFQLSKTFLLLALDLYFAFVTGVFLSLCTFYYDLFHGICMSVMLIPQFLYYILLKNLGLKYRKQIVPDKMISVTNILLFVAIVTIVLTLIEISVNLKVGQRIFAYK